MNDALRGVVKKTRSEVSTPDGLKEHRERYLKDIAVVDAATAAYVARIERR